MMHHGILIVYNADVVIAVAVAATIAVAAISHCRSSRGAPQLFSHLSYLKYLFSDTPAKLCWERVCGSFRFRHCCKLLS